jgi:hypothetical protein
MSSLSKIQFLIRLNQLSYCFEDIVEFLKAEKCMSEMAISNLKGKTNEVKAQEIYLALTDPKFLLVSWDWSILPTEILKLTIVTPNSVKEFSYSNI